MNHWAGQSVGFGSESQAVLSRSPSAKLIVFVHGYTGKAVKTWEDFDSILPQDPFFKGYDLLFYGYPGFRSNVIASAALLSETLEDIFRDPKCLVPNLGIYNQRSQFQKYDEITLVGHSLGSLLIRWALVMAYKDPQIGWKNANPRFLLFAPAHSGNLVETALGELRSSVSWISLVGTALGLLSPFLKELAPGSPVIQALQMEVAEVGHPNLRPKRVVVAELDQVVSNLPFPGDPMPVAIRGKGHVDICKPESQNNNYMRPIDILRGIL